MTIGSDKITDDDRRCSMPHCNEPLQSASSYKTAMVVGKDKEATLLHFCEKHKDQLMERGVNLMTLQRAKEELYFATHLEEAKAKREQEKKIKEEQEEFIQSLTNDGRSWCGIFRK